MRLVETDADGVTVVEAHGRLDRPTSKAFGDRLTSLLETRITDARSRRRRRGRAPTRRAKPPKLGEHKKSSRNAHPPRWPGAARRLPGKADTSWAWRAGGCARFDMTSDAAPGRVEHEPLLQLLLRHALLPPLGQPAAAAPPQPPVQPAVADAPLLPLVQPAAAVPLLPLVQPAAAAPPLPPVRPAAAAPPLPPVQLAADVLPQPPAQLAAADVPPLPPAQLAAVAGELLRLPLAAADELRPPLAQPAADVPPLPLVLLAVELLQPFLVRFAVAGELLRLQLVPLAVGLLQPSLAPLAAADERLPPLAPVASADEVVVAAVVRHAADQTAAGHSDQLERWVAARRSGVPATVASGAQRGLVAAADFRQREAVAACHPKRTVAAELRPIGLTLAMVLARSSPEAVTRAIVALRPLAAEPVHGAVPTACQLGDRRWQCRANVAIERGLLPTLCTGAAQLPISVPRRLRGPTASACGPHGR